MSDEKTREVPLTDVMGIAEVSDEPTETLPAVDDPGEAKTESFQKPFDEGVKLLNAIQDVYLCKEITIA